MTLFESYVMFEMYLNYVSFHCDIAYELKGIGMKTKRIRGDYMTTFV
jgi:hypothetical protein